MRAASVSRPTSLRDASGLAFFWVTVLVATFLTSAWLLLVLYLISIATVFWTVFRIRALSEHTNATATMRTHRFRVGALLGYVVFPYNTWMHWEHHRRPGIPWYQLAEVRARTRLDEPIVGLGGLLQRMSLQPTPR